MQPNDTVIFQSSTSKKIIYGALTVLGVVAFVGGIYLAFKSRPEELFGHIARLLFGLLMITWTAAFFLDTRTRLIFQNNTLQKIVSGKKSNPIDLMTVRITAFRSHTSNRFNALLFTDPQGNSCGITAYSLAALSKKDRVRLLQILEPFILKEGAVHQDDKPAVQIALATLNPDAPIKLTADAEELGRKARKFVKITKVILIACVMPVVILILLVTASAIFNGARCDALLADGKETTAKITALEPQTNKANELSTLRLELAYNVNGKAYNKEFYVYSLHAKSVYEKIKNASSVQIKYLPDDPRTIELASMFSDGTAKDCKF